MKEVNRSACRKLSKDGEKNSTYSEKYMPETVIQILTPAWMIVIDSAAHHSKQEEQHYLNKK
jgi:hypothetical protein